MPKLLPLTGLIVSGLVTILFVADLAAGMPFRRASVAADVGFVLTGLIIGYLSWSIMDRS